MRTSDWFWGGTEADPGSPTPLGAVEVPIRREFPVPRKSPKGAW